MHLVSCIPELLFVLLLMVALQKKFIWIAMFLLCVLKKIYLCCVVKFKSVLLKIVTYVSAMCSYRWLASRT